MNNDPQAAFVARFLREQHRLYGYIVTLIPHPADAEEVFQETSLRLWENWEAFDQSRDLLPWACGIAQNVLRNYVRKKKPLAVGFEGEFLDQLAAARLAQEDELASRRLALEDCLARLQASQRQLVEQCYSTSRPLHELAVSLGLTANALYLKLRRLRETLLDCISRHTAREASL